MVFHTFYETASFSQSREHNLSRGCPGKNQGGSLYIRQEYNKSSVFKEFAILESMRNLRNQKLGYRNIADEIKKKFGRKIAFQQVHKILNRDHNRLVA